MEEKTKELNKELEDREPINEPENDLGGGGEVESGEQTPQQSSKPIELSEGSPEQLKIGDIQLASSTYDIGQLCNIALSFLREPVIKDYLEKLKERRVGMGGSYFG